MLAAPRRLATVLATVALVTVPTLSACGGGDGEPGKSGASPSDGTPAEAATGVLKKPGTTWTLQASDIVKGGRFEPMGSVGDDDVPSAAGISVGGVLVVLAADESGGEGAPVLAGVSGAGKVLWKGSGFTGCWGLDDTTLVCQRGNALVRVDPTNGSASGGAAVTLSPGTRPVLSDGVVYAVVTPADANASAYPPPFAVTALDAASMKSVWSKDVGVEEFRGLGPGSPALDLGGDNVSVSAWKEAPSGEADATQFELDRKSGAVLSTTPLGKSRFLETPWTIHRGFGTDKIEVTEGDQVLLKVNGQTWDSQDGRLISADGLIGIGDALYDVSADDPSTPVWQRTDLGKDAGWRWTRDRSQIAVAGYDKKSDRMALSYLDPKTGKTLWSGPGADGVPAETADAFVQIATDYEKSWTLQALDRKTGDIGWTADLTAVGKAGDRDGTSITGPYVSTGDASTAVWALGRDTLTGWTDFGD